MGFGILSFACFLLLFPIRVSYAVPIEFFSLHSLMYVFLFMGFYQVQRRIRNRKIYAAIWISAMMAIIVFALPADQMRWLIDTAEPLIILCMLYGVKEECNQNIKKSITYFTILYGCIFISSLLISLYAMFIMQENDVMELLRQVAIPIVILRTISAIWLILICRRINHDLESMEIREYREIQLKHTKKHTAIVILLLLASVAIMYMIQGIYLESMY